MAMACVTGGRECDGCMECCREDTVLCPVCGNELASWDTVYSVDGKIIGCRYCVDDLPAAMMP